MANPGAPNRRAKGKQGETRAIAALQKAGYEIIERNWQCVLGEIDIVARHNDEIVFVEVRARVDGIDSALESVTRRKRANLARLASAYLNDHNLADAPHRIDVVAVEPRSGAVEIVEDAVGW
jgi:putative endonuclease